MPKLEEPAASSLHGPRVCVIDDDCGICDSLRFCFKGVDYQMEEIEDGVRALHFLQ